MIAMPKRDYQHDRHAEAGFHVAKQFEDLRLDRDVERGGGLIGDQ
jgi:hypothetical protein